ncbi:protein kinase, partial [Gemmatimonadota bacterium]
MIGTRIDRYQIIEKIGEGGMGAVYKAVDQRLKRTVAIKFLPESYSEDESAVQRFENEARAAAALDHPNIGVVHEVNETEDGKKYIVMAHYEGDTLKAKITSNSLSVLEALEYTHQIAGGLAEAHSHGVIHRDIKPSNIVFDSKNTPRIVDFGLAKLPDVDLTRSGSTLGTVKYAAPEQVRGEQIDERSDIWALGIILYEMLFGQQPFIGDNEATVIHAILTKQPDLTTSIRGDIPSSIVPVLKRSLEKDRTSRYSSAFELRNDLQSCIDALIAEPEGPSKAQFIIEKLKIPALGIPIISLVIVSLVFGFHELNQARIHRQLEQVFIPPIVAAIEADDYGKAFLLANELEQKYPGHPLLKEQLPRYCVPIGINTIPQNADVYVRSYTNPESTITFIGTTPIDKAWIPAGVAYFRIEHADCEILELVELVGYALEDQPVEQPEHLINATNDTIPLPPKGSFPDGMVLVAPQNALGAGFLDSTIPGTFPPKLYFMDRHEISNREFSEFVRENGYSNREYWKYPIIKDSQVLPWEEAMVEFRDTTGWPGPSTWISGSFPVDRGDYPVNGVSWYEAAAYAEYIGKSLPTVYHWQGACSSLITEQRSSRWISLAGNSDDPEGGTLPRYATSCVGPHGLRDMAGNVREWCYNGSEGLRYILGGSYAEVSYQYWNAQPEDPLNRSPLNGFRCVEYPGWDADVLEQMQADRMPVSRKQEFEAPCTDESFSVMAERFRYDPVAMNDSTIAIDTTMAWIREKVTYSAAYDDEMITAYLCLPRNLDPPYQVIVFFPGTDARDHHSSDDFYPAGNSRYLLERGRAVLHPVYKGTHERYLDPMPEEGSRAIAEYYVQVVQDVMRSIDYLETRDDIDVGKIAYMGFSWGAATPAVLTLALEKRI